MHGSEAAGGHGDRYCTNCATALTSDARFCPTCGRRAARPARASSRTATLAVSGCVTLFGVTAVIWSMSWDPPTGALGGPSAMTPTSAPEATIPLESVDPREVADNMFNHVVDAASAGDTAQLQSFLPLAVEAYRAAAPLDVDGLFHLSTLLRIGAMPTESLATASAILERDPDHLLGLGAAAAASVDLGSADEAASFYEHALDVFDSESDRPLTEYVGHSAFLSRLRSEAADYLETR